MVTGGLVGVAYSWSKALVRGLVLGQAIGAFFGLVYGGMAVIQHLVCALILSMNNRLSLQLVPFLENATDLIFLRRVGGGYIFVHRLLMEHFAEMYAETN